MGAFGSFVTPDFAWVLSPDFRTLPSGIPLRPTKWPFIFHKLGIPEIARQTKKTAVACAMLCNNAAQQNIAKLFVFKQEQAG